MIMKFAIPCIMLVGVMAAGSSRAQDTAVVDFVGQINGATCSLSISNATLRIGSVQQGAFTSVGTESPLSNTDIIVTDPNNCTATGVSMTFTAAADPNNRDLFAVNGGATGVGIRLEAQTSAGWRQAFPSTSPSASPIVNPLGAQNFRARYVQSASTVTTGTANANITVLVTYT